ncbi:MAG TPA: helix-turn-helix transcriptional regulator [Steroidobacteraceae bacterium]|jgi:PadR family transcriptional regulator PadR|nr:helix-turn-helix transcriptional regulator [Steroidobacteraceae bacterium]
MKQRQEPLGSLEHIVLLAVMRLGSNAYGVMVRREIENTTGRDISIGAVYATLVRLESKGLIKSFTGEPTAERGGRAKRYFQMTADGEGSLRNTHEIILKMSAGLKGLQAT